MHDLLHNKLHHVARKRRAAAKHQISDRTESIEVCTSIDAHFRLHLFRRHKFRRADNAA